MTLSEVVGGTLIRLQDESGVFEDIEPPEIDSNSGESEEEPEPDTVLVSREETAQL